VAPTTVDVEPIPTGHRPGPGSAAVRLSVRPRRSLPSGRAMLGGLLVGAAALGTFVAAGGGSTDPATRFVVAARAVPAGTPLAAGDLTDRPLGLDPAVADGAFVDAADLVGRVTLAPLAPGDLLQASAVADAPDPGDARLELSIAIPDNRVPPGLRRGETVTVLVTVGSGDTALTRPVLDRVPVIELTRSEGMAGRGDAVLTVAVTEPALALAGAHAARVGELTAVRGTAAFGGTADTAAFGGTADTAAFGGTADTAAFGEASG
jgi:hypothetical protein